LIESLDWDASKIKVAKEGLVKFVGNTQKGFETQNFSKILLFTIFSIFVVFLTYFFYFVYLYLLKNFENFCAVSLYGLEIYQRILKNLEFMFLKK